MWWQNPVPPWYTSIGSWKWKHSWDSNLCTPIQDAGVWNSVLTTVPNVTPKIHFFSPKDLFYFQWKRRYTEEIYRYTERGQWQRGRSSIVWFICQQASIPQRDGVIDALAWRKVPCERRFMFQLLQFWHSSDCLWPGRERRMALIHGRWYSHGRTWKGSQILASDRLSSHCCSHLRSELVNGRPLCLSFLQLCVSSKIILNTVKKRNP